MNEGRRERIQVLAENVRLAKERAEAAERRYKMARLLGRELTEASNAADEDLRAAERELVAAAGAPEPEEPKDFVTDGVNRTCAVVDEVAKQF